MDMQYLKFHGTAMELAENEFAASFTEDVEQSLVKNIYEEYLRDGSPKTTAKWLRTKLKNIFRYVDTPPIWIEKSFHPIWPFLDGNPMIFIKQFSVPDNEFCAQNLSAGTILYVFGGRRKNEHGFEMIYRVMEQEPGL
jgi:hypothetical protein